MGWSDAHRVDVQPGQLGGLQPVIVYRATDEPKAGLANRLLKLECRGCLHGNRSCAPRDQHSTQKIKCLCEALRDNDPARIYTNTSHATQIGAQRTPKLDPPSVIAVVERGIRRHRHRAIDGLDPAPARKQAHIRSRGNEVVAPARRDRVDERWWARNHRPHDRRRSRLDVEVALRSQLVVGVRHDASGKPQIRGESARRRQSCAGWQPALLDGAAQGLLQRPTHPATPQIEHQEEIERSSGLIKGARSGPVHLASKARRWCHAQRASPHRTNPAPPPATSRSVRASGDQLDPGRRARLPCRVRRRRKPGRDSHALRRDGDVVYVHGSTASRMLRALATGVDLCLSVTLLDGLVLARSSFHHSANYRSVVVFGHATPVQGDAEKMTALRAMSEHVVPGRWNDVRHPNARELRATTVLVLPLEEASAKVRSGPPIDDDDDYRLPVWAGVIPLRLYALTV